MSEPGGVVHIIVTDIPPDVWDALNQHAEAQNVSVREAVAEILSKRYDTERVPTKSSYAAREPSPMTVRVPEQVRQQMRLQAAVNGATIRGLVIKALAEELGIEFTDTGRRPRS